MEMNAVGIVKGVETIRPLRIAANTHELAKAKRAVGNDTEAKALEAAAVEIERLYGLLVQSLNARKPL